MTDESRTIFLLLGSAVVQRAQQMVTQPFNEAQQVAIGMAVSDILEVCANSEDTFGAVDEFISLEGSFS